MRTTGHAALGDNYPRPFLAASASASHSDADAEGAAVAGHEITRIEVARLDFPNPRAQEDFEHGQLGETLVEARDAIGSAHHLVIVPTLARHHARSPQGLL